MREVAFIQQNKEKWLNFEKAFFENSFSDPDALASLYIEIVNDLAFAQTNYPNSKTITYLNELASKAYLSIYKTKRIEQNRFKNFFLFDVPAVAYQYKNQIYLSFCVFLLFVLIGAVSARVDDSFVRLILGDQYVNITMENIQNGDPVAIYKSGSMVGSFLGITINNIRVAFMAFAYGVFAGLGTLYVLMQNGIMLGAFQTMFYNEGVLWESVKGIWIHGAMEIFAIGIAGASGLILAKGILFPRTYSRFQSFKIHLGAALKLLIGTIPFFIAAGILEGFVTRYSNVMTNGMSLSIIIITFLIIFHYFILYPIIYNNKSKFNATF